MNHKNSTNKNKIIVGYYPEWTSDNLPPEDIPFSKLTHINYAFAVVDEKHELKVPSINILKKLIKLSHLHGVKVLLSIGGWLGSKHFSSLVKTKANRLKFIKNITSIIEQLGLDGIDIDWEYPGIIGLSSNEVNSISDTPNFILLLTELHNSIPNKILTIAVNADTLFVNGEHQRDMKGIGEVVDFINIMAYDMNSGLEISGPNAPLDYDNGKDKCSFMESISNWTKSGVWKNKLVMGLAFYGKSRRLKHETNMVIEKGIYQKVELKLPKGDEDDLPGDDKSSDDYGEYSGIWSWSKLRSQNALMSIDKSDAGWTRYWDKVSETPYIYNQKSRCLVSYDDTKSLSIKAQVVIDQNLKGVMIWALYMDNNELLDTIHKVLK